MDIYSAATLLAEFILGIILFPKFIDYMKKLKLGQYIRQEGPDLHNYKEGTPTAGGIVFISLTVIAGLILKLPKELIFTLLFYGFIGFLDDFVSIAKKRSLGLKAWQKLALQFLFSIWIAYTILQYRTSSIFGIKVPSWLFYLFTMLLVSGYSNATNLTDGIDGLAGWVFVTSMIPFMFFAKGTMEYKAIFVIIMPLLSFLVYNTRPAKVFMGDTGSLALGAYISTYALMTNNELSLLFFTPIFLLETISVILQVGSYKLRGKRLFKMAPIHHHFELLGWKEEKIVGVFSAWNLAIAIFYIAFFLNR
ncbi:phospho-N-acetylmuramoyl-pentapeptide-transferase [Fervidobacterium sp. SC_NGM5_G05]|nr:phospho-N-acetylmuramoyl-pentapeptide-transferase [Fervidobacterium sp. SC_NGM5_G05]